MTGLEKFAKEGFERTAKAALKTGIDGLKEGKSFSEALKGGMETAKETALNELDNYLSPEAQEKIKESSEKIKEVQDKIEQEPDKVEANPAEEIKDTNEVTEKVNDVAQTIMENKDPSFLSGIKEGLQEFKAVLNEIQEVQNKLVELGVKPDILSMLNADAMEIDKMEDLEEEGEGTE